MRSIAFPRRLWRPQQDYHRQMHQQEGDTADRSSTSPYWVAIVVAMVLYAVALTYGAYLEQLRLRWSSIYHDRNAHYQAAVNVACELRQGRLLRALLDLDAASVGWPVLHPVLLSIVLTLIGPRPEAAVFPSLMGWCLSTLVAVWFVWRLSGRWGIVAGLLTAALFLTSPALRVMATDVMLESLGLGLTLAALASYARWIESPTSTRARWLGISLSALFVHKYNYWGLVVLALASYEVLRHQSQWRQMIAAAVSWLRRRHWSHLLPRHPLSLLVVLLLVISLAIWCCQGLRIQIGDWRWSIQRPRLLIEAAYGLFLLRLALWWWSRGRRLVELHWGVAWRTLLEWSGIPVLLWLALPFRLHYFVWYVSPGNDPGVLRHTLVEKARYYLEAITINYHVHPWVAAASAGLALLGVLRIAIEREAGGWKWLLTLFFILAGVLTWWHPNQQMRFVHTWLPVLWILSGVGAAWLVHLSAQFSLQLSRGVRFVVAAAAVTAVVLWTTRPPSVHPWFGRGYGDPPCSLRDVYDAYLDRLDGSRPVAILCNLPEASWRWPYLERFGHKNGLWHNLREIGVFDPVSLADAQRWAAQTDAMVIVYVEIPPTSPLYEPPPQGKDNSAILQALSEQSRFQLVERIPVGRLGTVYLWQRPDAETACCATIPAATFPGILPCHATSSLVPLAISTTAKLPSSRP